MNTVRTNARRRPFALLLYLTLMALLAAGLAGVAQPQPQPIVPVSHEDHPPGWGMRGYRLFHPLAPGEKWHTLNGIGPDGRVVGTMLTRGQVDGTPNPFVWVPGKPVQLLVLPEVEVNWPYRTVGVADNGDVYVWHIGNDSVSRVYRYSADENSNYGEAEVVVDDGRLGAESFEATAVNGRGDLLLAVHEDWNTDFEAVLQRDGTLRGEIDGLVYEEINDAMDAVGSVYRDPDGQQGPLPGYNEPTIWRGGNPPGESLGFPPGRTSAYAIDLNDRGDVLVRGDGDPFDYVLRSRDGDWRQLDRPDDRIPVPWTPWDMNNHGDVVGNTYEETDTHIDTDAVLWHDGRGTLLEDLLLPGTGFTLDQASYINDEGAIAGVGTVHNEKAVFVALPVDPVVFLHGMGASRMASFHEDGREDEELWLNCVKGRIKLSLDQKDVDEGRTPPRVRPTDVLRDETCYGAGSWFNPALNVYGSLLSQLKGSGTYGEYRVEADLDRQTTAGCDIDQRSNHPNLFVFTYDWRYSNVQSADKLADYLGCVQWFWPGRKVDILTHSMGSLVARRYVLDNPDDHGVDRMVTIGAPWLGAPKLVNTLYTGNFAAESAVNGPPEIIKKIVPRFTAAHQLAPGPVYGAVAQTPVLREAGWNLNNLGGFSDRYTDEDVRLLLDNDFAGTKPGTAALDFQDHRGGRQVDWRGEDTGIKYTHIVGLKAGADTIGTTVANEGMVCSGIFIVRCTSERWLSEEFVCGDGTVPIVSAGRARQGVDYNDPKAELLLFRSASTANNHPFEHTGMAKNPDVLRALMNRLQSSEPQDEVADHSQLQAPGIENLSCVSGQTTPPATAAARAAAGDGEVAEPAPGTALRYVSVLGGTGLTVSDSHGTTDPQGGTIGYVNGVTVFPSDRPDAAMATIPVSGSEDYRTRFTGTGAPLRLTLLEGVQHRPSQAARWLDVPLAAGVVADLTTAADGVDVLRVDSDADGTPDRVVPPTTRSTGADAADVTAPEPAVTALRVADTTRYAVTASDAGSGVSRILWSTDGTEFRPYQDLLELDPATTPTLTVFAEDRAGNRSAPHRVALVDVEPGLLTTATLDPAPTGAGWSPGEVRVTLTAAGPDGDGRAASVTYRTAGAQDAPERTVDGDSATLTVSAAGSTTVTFWATAADGTREPARTVQVRVDPGMPTATVRVPADGAVVSSLDRIAGTAGDDASGVAKVALELRDGKGRYWNGSAWVAEPSTLAVQGLTGWVRDTGLPAGDDLPVGGYRVRAFVTDAAGHTTASGSSAFTVGRAAVRAIHELPYDDGTGPLPTVGTAISDRGVAAGAAASPFSAGVRWADGRAIRLGLPEGRDTSEVSDVDAAGSAYGHASNGSNNVPVRWDDRGAPTVLPLPGTASGGALEGVSDDGRTRAGGVTVPEGQSTRSVPARWSGENVQLLPLPDSETWGVATAAADDGTVVGYQQASSGEKTALIWSGGEVHKVPTERGRSTAATDINNLGVVIGTDTHVAGKLTKGFVITGGQRSDLSGPNGRSVFPAAINDQGAIVGSYEISSSETRALLAEPGSFAVDLNTLLPPDSGWTLESAKDINNLGQIVGFGKHNGQPRGFVMTSAHAPVARDVSVTTGAGTAVEIPLDAFDPDVVDTLTGKVVDQPEHGTVSAVADGKVTYTPQPGFRGTDRFTYVASDGALSSAPGVVTVEVTPPAGNGAPEVSLTAPRSAVEGGTATLTAAATDPDGDDLTWTWSATGGEITGSGQTVTFTAGDGPADATVRVEVGDGTETVVRTATVHVDNAAPVVTTDSAVTVPWGVQTTLTGSVDDPGPQDRAAGLNPRWSFGDGTAADGAEAVHAWAEPGAYTAILTATDRDGATASAEVAVTVAAHRSELRLAATGGAFGTAAVTATVTDPDAGGVPVAGRSVVFTVDGAALPAIVTGADGTAAVPVASLPPGEHAVGATVAATERYLAGGAAAVGVTVTQSAGKVTGSVRAAEGCASFAAAHNGRTTTGSLTWQEGSVKLTIPVRSLGIGRTPAGKPAAWFAGSAGGRTFLAYVEDNGARGAGDVFRLWVDGSLRTATGTVTSGDVRVR